MKKAFYASALLAIFFAPMNGKGCTCIGEFKLITGIRSSDVIFSGKVIAEHILNIVDSYSKETNYHITMKEFVFISDKEYMGTIHTDTIKVVTGNGHGDCGYPFEVGKKYIVFAKYSDHYYPQGDKVARFLTTDICTNTSRKIRRISKKLGSLTK